MAAKWRHNTTFETFLYQQEVSNLVSGFFEDGGAKKMKEIQKSNENLQMQRKKLQRTNMVEIMIKETSKNNTQHQFKYGSPYIFDHNGFFT